MIERFKDDQGKRKLQAALSQQIIIGNDKQLAEKFANTVELLTLRKGEILIEQDAVDNDMYFIITGSFDVFKNGRHRTIRSSGEHVGEMAMIDIGAQRSATIVARETSLVARITEKNFDILAKDNSELWKAIAVQLGRRLREVNTRIRVKNKIPKVFIGSSSEALKFANSLRNDIVGPNIDVKVWDQDIFSPSEFALESLIATAQSYDFAIFVLHPDDIIKSRKKKSSGPRDNIIFEFGLFMGALGRQRTFGIRPDGVNLKIPSDFYGLTFLPYDMAKDRISEETVKKLKIQFEKLLAR